MRLRTRRKTLVIAAAIGAVLALLLALILALFAVGNLAGDSDVLVDDSDPTPDDPPLVQHLKKFQALADEYGDRSARGPGYEAAAEYVEEQLAAAGYDTERQYFTFERRGEEYETFNVIAETDGGSEDSVVMLGAHLDGVRGSAAMNDNASGVSALLEAAKAVQAQGEPTNTVRFVWWGAEEYRNSPGSRHYVEDLAENDPDELDAIAAYLNFDMIASPNYVIAVYDARSGEDEARLEVPDGSVEVMDMFTDYFDSQDQPWVGTGWDFDSDQVAFAHEGVAVGGLYSGSDERKTPREAALFGGTPGKNRDPNYHTDDDDIENINMEALTIMSDAITHAATTLARDATALE
ncbi:hypothetical protein GCM10022261_20560 [Brevibacterium daeguense]|uniref:Peptidase M28 domain-containing protein n=1 Tax=Brevibacterium daeguense TaxID=909936 RepID=A0ABP8EKL8_9MICO|nr:M20/M25/M40 family metallo-hydrolase [Brevibacterium daeguense]